MRAPMIARTGARNVAAQTRGRTKGTADRKRGGSVRTSETASRKRFATVSEGTRVSVWVATITMATTTTSIEILYLLMG